MLDAINQNSAANVQDSRKEVEMNTQTILYERLSVDDGNVGESGSIQHQKDLLEKYAEQNGLVPFCHVWDDGFSGTNWERPGWQKIMEEIEAGRVKTIVVKNLDRMGRDYLRVGLLLEEFKSKGIRLIAVSDNIDTSLGEDDFTPLRALFAEWFARDTSRKIKAVVNAKGKSGKPLTPNPPFGFFKDPDDKSKWLVDSAAAEVVRRIFNMSLEGIGPFEIAGILTAEKVECPSYYMGSRGYGNHKNNYNKEQPYTWYSATVAAIISKQEYCGHTVNFRTRRENFKSKKTTQIPAEEWLIFEHTHEAIISQEVWDTVQKLRKTPRRAHRFDDPHPLTGLLFCSDCGAKLYNSRTHKPKQQKNGGKVYEIKPQDTYECSTHKLNYRRHGNKCSSHHIRTEAIKEIILEALRKTGGYVREHEDEFVKLVRASAELKQGETAKSYQKQIAKNERRVAELEKIIRSLYEDKALGKIPEERYDDMSAGYMREQEELKQQTSAFQSELDAYNADSIRADKFIELVRRYTRFEELTGAMISECVDKVIVHEGEWSESNGQYRGTRTQQVDVYLKYIGKFEVPDMRSAEEIEAERIAEENAEKERIRKREYARQWRAKQKEKSEPVAVPAPPKPAA